MPEPTAVHVDSVLTNISIQYKPEGLIWDQVLPTIKVNKRSDVFFQYAKDERFRIPLDSIGPKSMANEIDWTVTTGNYSVKDYGLQDFVSFAEEENADPPLSIRIDTTEFLTGLLQIAQEKRVADIVFNLNSYPTSNRMTLSGTAQWGGTADDPIGNIMTALETPFVRPNVLIFGAEAWMKFRALPEVLDAVKSVAGGVLRGGLATPEEVASLCEVEKVLVGRARYNTAKEGQTATYARLWGKHCAALYVAPKPVIRSVTFGAVFQELPLTVYTWQDMSRGVKGGTIIKTVWNTDEKVICSDVGYFIQNAVA